MDKRNKDRFGELVNGNLKTTGPMATGFAQLLRKENLFAQTLAAYRFYNNERVSYEELGGLVLEQGVEKVKASCDQYMLIPSDWSFLSFTHPSKVDRMDQKKGKSPGKQMGYELQSSLVMSDRNGKPIMPIAQNLVTDKEVYSSYRAKPDKDLNHLQELATRVRWMKAQLPTELRAVQIIDREGDSVGIMRAFQANDDFFLIRAKGSFRVRKEGERKQISQNALAEELPKGTKGGRIMFNRKTPATLYVSEVPVVITRDASLNVISPKSGKTTCKKIPGDPVHVRFVVERVIADDGEVLATWMLLSNLPADVDAQTLGQWYCWRWEIESYFKLLKSANCHLEEWRQHTPAALFRRLLVASCACMLVWILAHKNDEDGKKLRQFLIKLSGRLMAYKKEYTFPALMAGLWNFLLMMDTFEQFGMDELNVMHAELRDLLGLKTR